MRSPRSILGAAVAAVALASAALPATAGTTRIETRPFYGAVVTIEEGVRVFRPLPNTDRVIINPGGQTPLSLGFNETYVNERNYNYNYNSTEGGSARGGGAPYGLPAYEYGYGRGNHGYGGHHGHGGHGRHGGGGRAVR